MACKFCKDSKLAAQIEEALDNAQECVEMAASYGCYQPGSMGHAHVKITLENLEEALAVIRGEKEATGIQYNVTENQVNR